MSEGAVRTAGMVVSAARVEVDVSGQGGLSESARKGIFSVRRVLARSLERNLPVPQSALAQALLLGLRGQLPPQVVDDFRATGTSHLLAISGLHVGVLLFMAMGLVSGTLGRGRMVYFLVPLAVIWMYAATSGFPISVVRAAIMGTTVLAAAGLGPSSPGAAGTVIGRRGHGGDRPQGVGPGFLPTKLRCGGGDRPGPANAAQAGGGAIDSNQWRRMVAYIWLGRWAAGIATALLVSVAATLATWPLVAYNFQQIPWMGIPATMLALPALPFALLGSLAAAVAGLAHPAGGQLSGWMAWLPLTYILKLVSWTPHITTSGGWVGVPLLVGWYALLVLGLLLPGGLARLARTASSLVRVWDRIQPVFGGFGHNESPQPAGIPWF